MSFDWLESAQAAGHDYTPTATADWRRAVSVLPPHLHADGRLEALEQVLDAWGERRALVRLDATLGHDERVRRLEQVDEEARVRVEAFVDLLRESPLLLQLAYVVVKQTQEEARLSFLPRAMVDFGRVWARASAEDRPALERELRSTAGDLIERYAGLELAIGDFVHEGVEHWQREGARRSLPRAVLDELTALGRERGLLGVRHVDRARVERFDTEVARRLRRPPFTTVAERDAGREAFEIGVESGLEAALDADLRTTEVVDGLTRRVDLGRLDRIERGLEDVDDDVRRLVLDAAATALGAAAEADERGRRAVLQEALERVLPRPGPRRRLVECLLDGDSDGALAARLLLELKGLPFDRARKLEALYRSCNAEEIAAVEARFEDEHAGEVLDARWLGVVKAGARLFARTAGRRELAARLAPVRSPLPLEELLDRKLRPVDRAAIESFRRGHPRAAELRLLNRALDQRSAVDVADLLEGLPFEERLELARRFEQRRSRPLGAVLEEVLPHGCSLDRARAALTGNDRLARAARLRGAFLGLAGHGLYEALDGLDPGGREQLIDDYEHAYSGASEGPGARRLRGLFQVDLKRMVGGESFALMEQVLRRGGLPPEDLCRYYMIGIGTNEAGLLETLRRLTFEEVRDVERRYDRKYRIHGAKQLAAELPARRAVPAIRREHERFGWRARAVDLPLFGRLLRRTALINGLVGDIRTEVSGDAWFDLEDALRGSPDPERPEDTRARLLERRRHELSGRLVRRWKIFRRMQTRLDADLTLALDHYDRELAGAIEAGAELPPEAKRRFHHLAALVLQDFDQFRGLKNRTGAVLGDRLAGVGATVGGLAAVAAERALHQQASLGVLVVGGTVGAFLCKFVPKKLIAGDSLGTEEIGIDLAHAVVEGAGRMFNRLRRLGAFAVDGIQRGLGRTAFKVGAKRTLDQVTRGLGGRLRARRDRLPELGISTFRPREVELGADRRRSRASVVGRRLEHPDDEGLERVFDGLVRTWMWAGLTDEASERSVRDE